MCTVVYELRVVGATTASVYVMPLQPKTRGSWCRSDRKKSYKPGDLTVVIVEVDLTDDDAKKTEPKIVAFCMHGPSSICFAKLSGRYR